MPNFEFESSSNNVVPLFGPTPDEFVARVVLINDQLQAQPVVKHGIPGIDMGIDAKVQLLVDRSRDPSLTPSQRFTAAALAEQLRQSLNAGP